MDKTNWQVDVCRAENGSEYYNTIHFSNMTKTQFFLALMSHCINDWIGVKRIEIKEVKE
jgi:hypothetical protein